MSDGHDIGGFGGENREGSIYLPKEGGSPCVAEPKRQNGRPQSAMRMLSGTSEIVLPHQVSSTNSIGKDNVRYGALLSSQIVD